MKHLLVALMVLCAFAAQATEPWAADSSNKKEKPKKELTPEQVATKNRNERIYSKFSKDRFAIDLNGSNWIYNSNDPRLNGMKPKWYSRGINIYFYYDFRIKKSRFSFAAGIGYSCSNINYDSYKLTRDSVGLYFKPWSQVDSLTHKVNKLALQYIDIPLEFRIKTNPDKLEQCWKFAIGIKAGVRVDAHTRTNVIEADGAKKVYIERKFPDFSLFRFGPTLRIGYSFFNLTAYYGVLDVFKKDRGPKANEFTVGISFNGL